MSGSTLTREGRCDSMSLNLDPRCLARLTSGVTERLRAPQVTREPLLGMDSMMSLRDLDKVLPERGPIRQALLGYVSETPAFDFLWDSLTRQLLDLLDTGNVVPGALTSLPGFENAEALAGRL